MMTTAGKNGSAPQRRNTSRILVVDDEDNVRITTAAILEQEGYELDTASDGHEALDKIKNGDFDLVLTDLRMEGLDGSALLQEICSKHPNVVTVVLTGYASIESSIDALRCGVYDYLVKPCVVDDLKLTVKRALEHKQQRTHISELSSPVVEIWDRILLLPVVGALDDARAAQMSGTMLETARRTGAEVIIIDITGCTVMDTHVAAHLINAVHSARLLGAHAVITGVSAMVAANLVSLGVELEGITTRRRLADGLRTAFEQLNVTVSSGRQHADARASLNGKT
ncbi:MAG TPA: response regulator [Pyrinomonadaceae bacterium]|jgi:CheY-like chemotaxis protein/anti-anti-sigma regulatory factor